MTSSDRPPKSGGTYGFLDVLRHPSLIRHPPGRSDTASDVEAIRRGNPRTVSCFLRGSFGPYPRRLTQGRLSLTADGATWKRFWSLRRRPVPIAEVFSSVTTRLADHRETNVKKGGSVAGLITIPAFVVVTGTTDSGTLDFVVSSADGPVVAGFFAVAQQ